MLKFKLFRSIALLVIGFGLLMGVLGTRVISSRVVQEAQTRVRADLNSAWFVYSHQLREIQILLRLVAKEPALADLCTAADLPPPAPVDDVRRRLEQLRLSFGLDFLTLVAGDGRVLVRGAEPYTAGDYAPPKTAIGQALRGTDASCTALLSAAQLEREGALLGERAYLVLKPTPRARPTPRLEESRGMVMLGAVPLERNGQVVGALYGGLLLNRNRDLVDRIQNVVFKDEFYHGAPVGTVTVFLGDSRVATTVALENGNRAYGTRVSSEVAERVLDNGTPWADRAWVVNDWYRSAYDPIRNLDGEVIGMLYVGISEQPFRDLAHRFLVQYIALTALALVAALLLAFLAAGRVSAPLHRLALSAQRLRSGEYPEAVSIPAYACRETARLICAFNDMAAALKAREAELQRVNGELAAANASLQVANHNYMETVQFVSHELKRPVATMVNYAYLLRQERLGPLTEKQAKAVRILDTDLKMLSEMIRHYLNLARIENNELSPRLTRVRLRDDILGPLLESFESDLAQNRQQVDNRIPSDLACSSDLNLTREVFENLLSNAIKYGRAGTTITLAAEEQDGMVCCTVRNEGDGIAPEQTPRLFAKFSHLGQADSHGQRPKGTGLGLFITRQIVEAHGGTIAVRSEPGQWAEFRFTLPLDRSGPATAAPAHPPTREPHA